MIEASVQGVCLGFDYGEKRIGVAVGNTETGSAMPVGYVRNNSGTPDWETLEKYVGQWQPVAVVVGEPLTLDGSNQQSLHQARGFARRLGKRLQLPVYLVDERYSSMQASDILRQGRASGARGKTQKSDIDKIAATILLQRWFDETSE